ARDLVMRGWALYQRPLNEANRREALQAFERAQAIDPNLIDAKIGIAAVLAVNLANGTTETPKEDEARAEQLLADALQRDPNRAQIHVTIALLRRLQNRLTESRIEWERALALDPNHAAAYGQLGVTRIYLGDPAAASGLARPTPTIPPTARSPRRPWMLACAWQACRRNEAMLSFEPTGAVLGATVHGGDLAQPLGEREFGQILIGLGRYGVLRFPDQHLD